MNDIRDIKAPIDLGNRTDWTAWAAGSVLLAFGGLAVWRWRRLRAADAGLRDIRAELRRLDAEEAGLDDRAFYYRLAALMRRAIEARFALGATAMATGELLPHLGGIGLSEATVRAVAGLLGRADPARYGGENQDRKLRMADLATAWTVTGRKGR